MDEHFPPKDQASAEDKHEEEDELSMQRGLSLIQSRALDGREEFATEYETESNGTHMYTTEDTGDASGREFSGREDNGDRDSHRGGGDGESTTARDTDYPRADEPETLIDADDAWEDADDAQDRTEPRVIAFDDFAPTHAVGVWDVDATDDCASEHENGPPNPYVDNSESDVVNNIQDKEGNEGHAESQEGSNRGGHKRNTDAGRQHIQRGGQNDHAVVLSVPSSAAMSPSNADPAASVNSAMTTLSRGLNYVGTRLNSHPYIKQAVDGGGITAKFIEAMTPQRAEDLYGEDVAERLRLSGLRINTLSTGDPVDFVLVYKPEKVRV